MLSKRAAPPSPEASESFGNLFKIQLLRATPGLCIRDAGRRPRNLVFTSLLGDFNQARVRATATVASSRCAEEKSAELV